MPLQHILIWKCNLLAVGNAFIQAIPAGIASTRALLIDKKLMSTETMATIFTLNLYIYYNFYMSPNFTVEFLICNHLVQCGHQCHIQHRWLHA